MAGSRALGYGLLAGGAGIAVLMLLWLLVSGAQAGGIVLGLLLLFVLAAPLLGAGWYVLSRQPQEAAAEAAFVGKRRIVEADRLFRRELGAALRQLARRPGVPAARLAEMAEDLERKSSDSPEWYDTVRLDDADAAQLQRYDDLVWERVRRLRDHADGRPQDLEAGVRELQQALDQRQDLLLRGRRAPAAAPSTLLRAGEPRRDAVALQKLAPGDAVTYDGVDYLADGVASYFDEGQTWKLVHLAPSGPDGHERWLYVGPGALELGLLDEVPGARPDVPLAAEAGGALPLAARGSASVDVASKAGAAQGVLVAYWSYRAGDALGFVEQWPDGAVHGYVGRRLRPSDLELWPAVARAADA